MPDAIQKIIAAPDVEDVEADTDAEFKVLWEDAKDGMERMALLSRTAQADGQPHIAAVYSEISGTVLSILQDLAAATGGALTSIEDHLDTLPGGGDAEGSQLLPDDANKYLQLFEQFKNLLQGLDQIVPVGPEGDAQREIFATLNRMTDGLAEFTREITLEPADADDEEEEDEDDEEEEPAKDA